MFRRRQSRSSIRTYRPLAAAAIELLEDKRLLSGVNSAGESERTITITDPSLEEGTLLTIQEVHVVDNEIWVLTQTRTPQASQRSTIITLPAVIDSQGNNEQEVATAEATASVSVIAPDLPVVEFRIGGVEGGSAIPIGGFADFHQSLEGHTTEIVFSQADPELSEWRETVYRQLAEEAETQYADQFGQETEGYVYWLWDGFLQTGDLITRTLPAALFSAVEDTTNVQVDGVDEADIVETDGDYIYSLEHGQVVILSVAEAGVPAAVVSRTALPDGNSLAMFLHDGRLTVISRDYDRSYVPFIGDRVGRPAVIDSVIRVGRTRTVVSVFDVSNPASPTLEQETVVDGNYQGARAIGDQVYVVINNNDSIPYLPSPNVIHDEASSTNFRYENRDEYLSRLQTVTDQLDPPSVYHRAETSDGESALQRLGWLNGATDVVDIHRPQLTSILQFDASSSVSSPVDDIGVRTQRYASSELYASVNAIYLVNVEYLQAESGGDFIRVPDEEAISRINKIDISGDKLTLEATGQVAGIVESQFSLDEHNGYLRVMTTTNAWSTESLNHVYVLQDTGTDLEVVGSILGLAPTERIYSARFDGDRAWMVTFRQVDPVFSLDLSDPTNPVVTGELKIPGFSEYLQLIDENHLLAIGRGATEDGRVLGVEVSLFDISDMTSPELLHRRSLSEDDSTWGHSVALNDHHAFNYLPESGLLVIPYTDRDSRGLTTLSIDIQDGIEIVAEASSDVASAYVRSLQIGEFVYAIGYDAVSVLHISDPGTILYDVVFNVPEEPLNDHETLLKEHLAKIRNRLEVREYIGGDGERTPQIELSGFGGLIETVADELLEFEFTVSEVESGVEVLRRLTEQPWLSLDEDGQEILSDGTYEFTVRTRSQLLDNPEWSEWIQSQVVSIGDKRSEMLSAFQLPELAPLLEWSEIADEVRTILDGEAPAFDLNPVDHYEVWVTDANTQRMVLRDREVQDSQRSLEGLQPGRYYSWFRAIFEDGTEAPWSARKNFEIQGRPLELLNNFVQTADLLPDFSWQDIAGAESFEIEITSPDGQQTMYSAAGLLEARHEITQSLTAGTYQLRVRALLESGVTTDWAVSEFTILDRPEVRIHNRHLDLRGADSLDVNLGEAVEIWVNKAGTFERVFHSAEWTDLATADLVEAFGLTNQVGEYDIWTRLVEQDGESSRWSTKQTFEVFHDAISVLPIDQFAAGELQEFVWEAVDTVQSYELFIQKEGQAGAAYRQSGLTGAAHQLTQALPAGNYKYWLRGELENGHTPWTDAFNVVVGERPSTGIRFEDNQIAWDAVSGAVRYELWVNEVDSQGNLLASRVAHYLNLTESNYSTELLPTGNYSAWVKSHVRSGNGLSETLWSERLDFKVAGGVSDLFSSFTDRIEDVLSILDRI